MTNDEGDRIESINRDLAGLRDQVNAQMERVMARMESMERVIAANTESQRATSEAVAAVATSTAGVVEAFNSAKAAFAFFDWFAGRLKSIAIATAACSAIGGAIYMYIERKIRGE